MWTTPNFRSRCGLPKFIRARLLGLNRWIDFWWRGLQPEDFCPSKDKTPQAEAYATKTSSLTAAMGGCIEMAWNLGEHSHKSQRGKESMKTNYKFGLAVLVGALIGVAGATVIHARQMKMLPGYAVAEVDVTDPATFQKYAEKAPGTIA